MRILVTGGKGTVGAPLVKKLKEQGHDIFVVDLKHSEDENFMRCDISEYRQLEEVFKTFKNIDIVYHLAAEFGRNNGEDYYEKVWKTNVIGTKNILELQKQDSFGKLVFFSSSEIYGDIVQPLLYEELSLHKPLFQKNDYAISKWVNELQIKNHIDRNNKEVMIVRLFNAYGPGEYYHPYRSVVCLFCYRALKGLPYEVYKNYHRVFMYIDDLIPTLCKTIPNFKNGRIVNIGGTEYRSVEEMSNIILSYLGKDDSLVKYLEEDKHNTINKRPDISIAKQILQHNPTVTLEQGIPKTIEWLRNTYSL